MSTTPHPDPPPQGGRENSPAVATKPGAEAARAPERRGGLPHILYTLAKRWVQMLTLISTTIFGSTVGVLAGFAPPPAAAPAFDLVKAHPVLSIAIGALLLGMTIASWRLVHSADSATKEGSGRVGGRGASPLLLGVMTAIATLSTVTVVLLISLVLTRPTWCPNALCPQPPGPHDQYLETGFTALQSSFVVIPGDPAQYSLGHLPPSSGRETVAAGRTSATAPNASPYRVVVRIHSLQTGRFGMIIEEASLLVVGATPPPNPLRVWLKGAPLEYTANPFTAQYAGQQRDGVLAAQYAGPVREGHVQLDAGESDELAIQVRSASPVDLKFKVTITYRIANEDQLRRLTMPYVFEVVFSDALNWQPYSLQGGRLLPA